MADTDEDLQTEVNNAVAAGTDSEAENANEDSNDVATQGNNDTSDADEEVNTSTEDADGETSDTGAEADEEDDDDDDDSAPFQPATAGKVPENFDIRTLPRDANGLIDPEAANKAIQDWADKLAEQKVLGIKTESEAREVLTTQWSKAKEKYPYLSQNKDLASLTRDLHLNSITAAQNGTGRYLSPLAAAKKVDKMYRRAVKSGVAQQRTKQTVERSVTTERSSGKGTSTSQTEYQKASEMALSKDPKVAQEGRRQIMTLRYAARHS